jgi:serine/threonine protein kinase
VVAWAGRGVYGAVYKAERVGEEHAGPVALKLALNPGDPRFVREAELLRRLRHPSIPYLRDTGDWPHPSGALHPYLVMEWIDGLPLYDWAKQHEPSSEQGLRILAQLARALEALHALDAVHRDVKGANILVRLSDGRAFLTDFGSGNYPGTSTLTPYDLLPGTPVYRSWEGRLFPLRFGRDRTARYQAGPADDLCSLGMTGYKLLTGEYLEPAEPFRDEAGTWQLPDVEPPAKLVLNPRVTPQLSALILRMVSVRPEQRGTTSQLAEALEHAAEGTLPPSASLSMAPQPPPPLVALEEQPAAAAVLAPEQSSAEMSSVRLLPPRADTPPGRPWLAMATAALALLAWAWWAAPNSSLMEPSALRIQAAPAGQEAGDTTGLGEAGASASTLAAPSPSAEQVLAEDPLPKPLPGQLRPDANGRCRHKRQVALNGGCWVPLEQEQCEAHIGQLFKGRCYVPAFASRRPPAFSPASDD